MLASAGAIVQDLYTFPFMDKWYQGEKMWGLHEAAIKSGAMWQVLPEFAQPKQLIPFNLAVLHLAREAAHLLYLTHETVCSMKSCACEATPRLRKS
jgi:hypothetical protein